MSRGSERERAPVARPFTPPLMPLPHSGEADGHAHVAGREGCASLGQQAQSCQSLGPGLGEERLRGARDQSHSNQAGS